MIGAAVQVVLVLGPLLLLESGRLRKANPPTRFVAYLFYALGASIYVAVATWPELPRPALLLLDLLRPISPTY